VVDRDVVEISNLPRQLLYDEGDIGEPKAIVLKEKLNRLTVRSKLTPGPRT
jgi:molybdopterin/thiamine biosynthesis adenylyltransferase